MQRTAVNTSLQNVPRGLINTAFSLSSVVSLEQQKPSLPTTPQNILKYYLNELTDYEKGEILDYDKIYYLGQKDKKVDASKLNQTIDKSLQSSKSDSNVKDSKDE